MIPKSRLIISFFALYASAPALNGPLLADELAPEARADTADNVRCAALGPGFAAVEGSSACVKISGHVRVELGGHGVTPAGSLYGADSGMTQASSGRAIPTGLRSDDKDKQQTYPQGSRGHLRLGSDGGVETIDSYQ